MMATVLLIEEHEPLRILYEQVLEDEGYSVITARDCGEALHKSLQSVPDVIVLEPMNQSPSETWSLLWQATGQPPVIWHTGRPDYRDRATAAGAHFVLKSSDIDGLCAQVERCTAHSSFN
jgi:DNA-binding response OmpR family regulator